MAKHGHHPEDKTAICIGSGNCSIVITVTWYTATQHIKTEAETTHIDNVTLLGKYVYVNSKQIKAAKEPHTTRNTE